VENQGDYNGEDLYVRGAGEEANFSPPPIDHAFRDTAAHEKAVEEREKADPVKKIGAKEGSSKPITIPVGPEKAPATATQPAEKVEKAATPTATAKTEAKPTAMDAEIADKAQAFISGELEEGDLEGFMIYCAAFGKNYDSLVEFKQRLFHWRRAEKFVREMNQDESRRYKVAHNKFSDYSPREFQKLLGYAQPVEKQAKNIARMRNSAIVKDSIDWRELGMVSAVAD